MGSTRRKKIRGTTLLEVVFALFLVAGGAIMFAAVVPTSSKTGKMVGNYQQASSLIQHKLDQVRAVGFGRLDYEELRDAGIIDPEPDEQPFRFDEVDDLDSIYPGPKGTIEVFDESATLKRVVVTLEWEGSAFRQGNGSFSVEAYVAKG
jgi:type II secretory pathway pseudopilin PulG